MKRDLRGRVAIVTGASSGVGWASAVRLAEQGVRLCLTARRREALERLASRLRAGGAECLVAPGDVTSFEDVESVVARTLERFGRIDLLVNVAGVQAYGEFDELDWAEVVRIMDTTFFGYLRFARAVLPHFRRQGSGHIVNVLSMLSVGAAPLLSVYTAAKHALLGWAESLRLELWTSGIDVSGVLCPSVATPMFDHAPTKLGRAPRPIPPTYDPDVAARAVVRCARRPRPRAVPVFLQGVLPLLVQRTIPSLGDAFLGRFGRRLQTGSRPIDRPRGNLFEPVAAGVGPRGSLAPTPRWLRFAAAAAIVGAASGLALGARALARRIAS